MKKNFISLLLCGVCLASVTNPTPGINLSNREHLSVLTILKAHPFLLGMAACTTMVFIASAFYKFFHNSMYENNNHGFRNFKQFSSECKKSIINENNKTVLTNKQFQETIQNFIKTMEERKFKEKQNWLIADDSPFKTKENNVKENKLRIFAQKLSLTDNVEIAIHADIHGDILSLLKYLEDLQIKGHLDENLIIKNPNFYLVFLGDYTDRIYYGLEVLYTILKLKIANPNKVILIRGNHEDINMNRNYGLMDELKYKFKTCKSEDNLKKICEIYDFMPAVVYIGNGKNTKNYAIFCHGGLEPGFNPSKLLKDKRQNLYQIINKKDYSWLDEDTRQLISKNTDLDPKKQNEIKDTISVGFIWNDFFVDCGYEIASFTSARGFTFGKIIVEKILNQSEIKLHKPRVIFRGHQHSDQMLEKMIENHGLYSSWSEIQWSGKENTVVQISKAGPVWTLNASPSIFGKQHHTYNTYAILKLNKNFNDWTLSPHKVQVDS